VIEARGVFRKKFRLLTQMAQIRREALKFVGTQSIDLHELAAGRGVILAVSLISAATVFLRRDATGRAIGHNRERA
jgi:hypothetical protein